MKIDCRKISLYLNLEQFQDDILLNSNHYILSKARKLSGDVCSQCYVLYIRLIRVLNPLNTVDIINGIF